MGTLTRPEMEAIIKSGESVMHNGIIHWQADTLPSEADLALGDEHAMTVAEASINDQIAMLLREKAKLAGGQAAINRADEQRAARDREVEASRLAGIEQREQELADQQEAFRREVAARQSVSDDAAAAAAQQLQKEREDREKAEAEERERTAKEAEGQGEGGESENPPSGEHTTRGRGRPAKDEGK